MRASRGAAIPLVLALVCTACVPVPIIVPVLPHNEEGKPITEELIAFIRPGVTQKADVVWGLGAPDNESSGENAHRSGVDSEDWLAYRGVRVRGGVVGGIFFLPFVGSPYKGGLTRVCRTPWVLKIWFDDADIVTRRELTQGDTQCRTEDW